MMSSADPFTAAVFCEPADYLTPAERLLGLIESLTGAGGELACFLAKGPVPDIRRPVVQLSFQLVESADNVRVAFKPCGFLKESFNMLGAVTPALGSPA